MRRLLFPLVLVLAWPALAADGVWLAVRRMEPTSTGFNPRDIDAVLLRAFSDLSINTGEFIFAREFEAQVVANVRGEAVEGKHRLVFTLETGTDPILKDVVTVELSQPDLGPAGARTVAAEVVRRAQSLHDQVKAQRVTSGKIEPRPPEPGTESSLPQKPPPPRTWGLIDVEVSGGLNAPAGLIGGRVELHPLQYFGLALAGGWSLWGPRLSPSLRVYPFGLGTLGVFGELSLEQSLGESTTVRQSGQAVALSLLPTTALQAAVGIRQQFLKYVVAGVFLGWSFRLTGDNVRDAAGLPADAAVLDLISPRQPGGLVAGASIGVSLF